MRRKEPPIKTLMKAVMCAAAGVAALVIAREAPAMYRYYRMTRL